MAAFIFSAALAFILYQALAFAHVPAPTRDWFRISSVTISFDDSSARWARIVLRAAIVFVVLACVLLIHEVAVPADAVSRSRVAILIGFFFGPLFAMWINVIFAHPPGRDLTRGQIIAGIGLVLMFLVGSFGNETGRLIVNKLQSVKLAGAELSFTDKTRSDHESRLAGAFQLSGDREIVGSAALGYLSQTDEIINRDLAYVQMFDPSLRNTQDPVALQQLRNLKLAAEFFQQTLKLPFGCLAIWYQWTADGPTVRGRVAGFAAILRQLGSLDDQQIRAQVWKSFIRESITIAEDIAAMQVPREVDSGCKPLVDWFCPPPAGPSGSAPIDRAAVRQCLALRRKQIAGDGPVVASPPFKITEDQFADGAKAFIGGEGKTEPQPYLAIIFAGALAELQSYEGAAATLHLWLREDRSESALPVIRAWLAVRARSMMAAYVDEWIGRTGVDTPTALLTSHIENLEILRKSLKQYLAMTPVFAKILEDARNKRSFLVASPGACTIAGGDFEYRRKLFQSYISMELTHAQNALRHAEYADKFADSVSIDIAALASLDLSCYPGKPEDPVPESSIVAAEILQAYARNALMYTAVRVEKEPEGTANARLDDAQRAVRLGLEKTKVAKEQPGLALVERKSFLDLITPDRRDNAEAALKRTLDDIKRTRRELTQ